MSLSTDPYVWIAALLTLAAFSFLYRDNPVFCFAEHLLVGLSAGYLLCTYWHNVFWLEFVRPLATAGLGKNAHLWVVAVLCLFWAGKYAERTRDFYRFALAFWVAIDLGLAIPTTMEAEVLRQVAGTVGASFDGGPVVVLGSVVMILGTVAALAYFFFSSAHEGAIGVAAKAGTYVLMIGFGATFSYTILSRVYLLVGRLLFLFRDWLGIVS
jgi:hypothetical protein